MDPVPKSANGGFVMKLSFNSSPTPVVMRVKRMTKASCERAGRVYRKGFKARGRKRVGPTCAKKARRRR